MRTDGLEKYKKSLQDDGYALLENVISKKDAESYVAKLNAIYSELELSGKNIYPGGVGANERLIINLHNKDESFIDLVDCAPVIKLVGHLLQAGSYQNQEPYILTQFNARDPHLNRAPQQLHIDSRYPGPPFPLMVIALWIMNDFTISTGATHVVPGSHKFTAYPESGARYDTEKVVVAPAGSVLIYNASLWHGGGEKKVDTERWSIIVSYGRWFLKPSFDFTKNTPHSLYSKMSSKRRELFGFTSVPPHDENERARARTDSAVIPKNL